MDFLRHKRLHLTQGGRFLGYNADTRAEESFDLLAECAADKDAAPSDVLARHLADDGKVTTEEFSVVTGAQSFKPKERAAIDARALVMNGPDMVDYDRVLRFTWSRETPNRSRIVVPNDAWNLEPFSRNPVGLWNHQSYGGPEAGVARWPVVGHKTASAKSDLVGYSEFVSHQVNPMATKVLDLYRAGVFSAVSPGFMIGVIDFDDEENLMILGDKDSPNELVEQSFTPVPRHADALTFALEAGTVELSTVRDLITYQLEAAYSNPVQLMETARLEAWAAKLGMDRQAFVEMSLGDIEELSVGNVLETEEEPAEPDDTALVACLRAGNAEAVAGSFEIDEDAWARFRVAVAGAVKVLKVAVLPDVTMATIARAAGLNAEADAWFRVMSLEEEAGISQIQIPGADVLEGAEEPEENSADDGEDGAEGSGAEGNGIDVERFAGLIKEALGPVAKAVTKTGRLVIPA